MNDAELLEIVARARGGDKSALTAVVKQFSPFLRGAAARIHAKNKSMPVDDLLQEGSLGLLRAVATYRTDRGAKFSTFALLGIQSAMLTALRAHKIRSRRVVQHTPHTEQLEEEMPSQEPSPVDAYTSAQTTVAVKHVLSGVHLDASKLAILKKRLMTDSPEALERLAKRFRVTGEALRKREIALKALLRKRLECRGI